MLNGAACAFALGLKGERHWRIWGSCLRRAAVVARTARVGVENAGRAVDVQSAPLFYTVLQEGPGTLGAVVRVIGNPSDRCQLSTRRRDVPGRLEEPLSFPRAVCSQCCCRSNDRHDGRDNRRYRCLLHWSWDECQEAPPRGCPRGGGGLGHRGDGSKLRSSAPSSQAQPRASRPNGRHRVNRLTYWSGPAPDGRRAKCGNMRTDINECKQNYATPRRRRQPTSPPSREAAHPACARRRSSGDSHWHTDPDDEVGCSREGWPGTISAAEEDTHHRAPRSGGRRRGGRAIGDLSDFRPQIP